MASGQQLAKHNLEQFRTWRATQTDEDFLQIIHLGRLKRVEIAKAIGCGKSALTQNPGLRAEIDALESELRNRGILPPVVEAAHTSADQSREYNISATRLARNDHRSARLDHYKHAAKNCQPGFSTSRWHDTTSNTKSPALYDVFFNLLKEHR